MPVYFKKGHWKNSIRPSSVMHIFVWRALTTCLCCKLNQTQSVSCWLLCSPSLSKWCPPTVLPHFSPGQLGCRWGFTLLARIKSRRPPSHSRRVCLSVALWVWSAGGREAEGGWTCRRAASASLFCPCCFHIVLNLETLGRMCAADFLPWGSRAIPALHLWYKNDGWKGREPAASGLLWRPSVCF